MISAFSVSKPSPNAKFTAYDIRPEVHGYSFLTPEGGWERIDDVKPNQQMFQASERINIDKSWIPSCEQPIETSIGTLLFNNICLMPSFGAKFPYMAGRITVKAVEKIVAPRLKRTPKEGEERNNGFFYCDENIKFRDSLQYLSMFDLLFCWSATPKAITEPDGIKAFKAQLLKKYEGKLEDPVEFAKFESELKEFDKAYLADDPCYQYFMTPKILNNSRKKLYLTIGAEEGFDKAGKITPVVNALSEGWPLDPKEFAAINNSSRLGSYSRGVETINGGVSAKALLRAANNYEVVDEDCGTKLGIMTMVVGDKQVEYLIKRNVFVGGKTVHVPDKEAAGKYLGKAVIVRSPQYCKSPGETLCQYCVDFSLLQNRTGLAIPLMEMSAIVLAASMAKMHAATLSLVELDLEEALS